MHWVTKTWGITKQGLFDKITENDIILSAAASIGNKKKTKDSKSQLVKQRVTKKNLDMINQVSKSKNISRDELISETLLLLYENLSKKYNEDIIQTNNVKSDIDRMIKTVNSLEKKVSVNKHLEKSYYKKTLDIKTKLEKLAKIVNDDIVHYKSNIETNNQESEKLELDTENSKKLSKALESWSIITSHQARVLLNKK